jgi:hypothetical protein
VEANLWDQWIRNLPLWMVVIWVTGYEWCVKEEVDYGAVGCSLAAGSWIKLL